MFLFQSKYKEEGKKEASMSLYSVLPETPEIQHAREASELRSEVLMSVSVRNSTKNRHFQTFLSGSNLKSVESRKIRMFVLNNNCGSWFVSASFPG